MSNGTVWIDDEHTVSVKDITDNQLLRLATLVRQTARLAKDMADLEREITGREPDPEGLVPPGMDEINAEVARRGLSHVVDAYCAV